jgi:hypothetical protein
MRKCFITFAVLLGLAVAFGAGWVGGGMYTHRQDTERRYRDEVEAVMPVLSADPAFQKIEPSDFPVKGFCLLGSVATQADYDRLWNEVTRLVGETRVDHVMADVRIVGMREPPKPTRRNAGNR